MTLPLPTWDNGEVPPAGDELPEAVDPSVPPEPFLDDADGGSIGTGVRSAESNNRGTWRRTREPRGMPRLLPSQSSGRGVSPISYEELITPQSSQKLDIPETMKQTDVFQVASKVEATEAAAVRSNVAAADVPLNPLRR